MSRKRSSSGSAPVVSRTIRATVSASPATAAGAGRQPSASSASGSRWVCTVATSGTSAQDRPLDLLGDRVRLLERQARRAASGGARARCRSRARRRSRCAPRAHAARRARPRARARARGRSPLAARRGRRRPPPAAPPAPPAPRRRRRRAPGPTGASKETPITTSANTRPAACRIRSRRSSDGGANAPDRAPRSGRRVRGGPVHQHVDVAAHQPDCGAEYQHRDEERRRRVGVRGDLRGRARARRAPRPSRRGRCRNGARSTRAPRSRSGAQRATTRRCGRCRSRITTPITTSAYQRACTCEVECPASRETARQTIARLASARIAASPSAARCSAFPCPYWWPVSAGRCATPTAKKVRSAATRSVPECAASEIRPRLPVARPVPSFRPISAVAASTEKRAVLR